MSGLSSSLDSSSESEPSCVSLPPAALQEAFNFLKVTVSSTYLVVIVEHESNFERTFDQRSNKQLCIFALVFLLFSAFTWRIDSFHKKS